jgi:tRNA dimethylallyltransferase
MDIGTAKATRVEREAVPHHLLDLIAPSEAFHAAAWAAAARQHIVDAASRERLPIIVGGTGLYYRALVRGLFEAPPADAAIRARHQAEAAVVGIPALHERLRQVDPAAAAKILPGDLVRVSRALEVFEQTGIPISELRRRESVATPLLRVFSVLLDFELDYLRPRIASRVDGMLSAGFLEEVRSLREAGYGNARSLQALGYKQLGQHLDGELTLEDAISQTKLATVAYARRQRTWFRREEVDMRALAPLLPEALARLIRGWLLV